MIVRFKEKNAQIYHIGIKVKDYIYDITDQYPTVASFVGAHPDGWESNSMSLDGLPVFNEDEVMLGPPVDDGASVYLVGANYKKHAEEAGLDVPQTPVIFMKPTTSLIGSGESICLSKVSQQMDYEGELAVVIGRSAHCVGKGIAKKHVAGLTIVNDVTARDLQWVNLGKHRIVDWLSSKCLDRSTPVGPGIVSVNLVSDPHMVNLKTHLNDKIMQDSTTSLMVFSIWDLIEFLSARLTLRPGDIISTGTPVGVGGFRKIFLKPGDSLRIEVEKVGVLQNTVIND